MAGRPPEAAVADLIAFLRTRLDGMRAAGRRGGAAPAAAAAAADTPPATAEREFSPAEESQIARLVEQAYLRTLTRPPRPEEVARAVAHFQDTGDLTAGARDLLWALINTKEFVVNH
jgi:hypothetical protein